MGKEVDNPYETIKDVKGLSEEDKQIIDKYYKALDILFQHQASNLVDLDASEAKLKKTFDDSLMFEDFGWASDLRRYRSQVSRQV